jgi:DNA-binding GntR family transcriptional regulator
MAFSVTKFQTKADLAEEYLRERVLSGKLEPGERVPISHVARELGISDIPVREGVTRLEAEGLLQIEAHKVAVVTRLGATRSRSFSRSVRSWRPSRCAAPRVPSPQSIWNAWPP